MGTLFGTDGIRAPADERLERLATDVGAALVSACRDGAFGTSAARPRVVVGRDPRPSGPRIEASVVRGMAEAGADVLRAGVLPTPAVAYLVSHAGADAGVVVSASHNPPSDNGIKLFGPGGFKLDRTAEDEIERIAASGRRPTAETGTVSDLAGARAAYVDHLCESVEGDLSGVRVVMDCANGSVAAVIDDVLSRLRVEARVVGAERDGTHINEGCGATHPEVVARLAASEGVVGLTFDGDGDRVLCADEKGTVVDGDGIIALLAARLRADGRLAHDTIAVTVMSNQSLRRWCDDEGIKVIETPVGDRNVLEAMRANGLVLGGEQAGHVIRLDRSTTGDGMLIGLGLLEIVASSGSRLADLVPFRPLPQVLVNVRTSARVDLGAAAVRAAVEGAERRLGEAGRVLVRASGTEPIVRVMVEAPTEAAARELADLVARTVRDEGA